MLLFAMLLAVALPVTAAAAPDHCQIEIINASHHDVWVRGTFDDWHPLLPFRIHPGEPAHFIDLFAYRYCHRGMVIVVESARSHSVVYHAWTHTGATIHISRD